MDIVNENYITFSHKFPFERQIKFVKSSNIQTGEQALQ